MCKDYLELFMYYTSQITITRNNVVLMCKQMFYGNKYVLHNIIIIDIISSQAYSINEVPSL
jgi:hypothetical protein